VFVESVVAEKFFLPVKEISACYKARGYFEFALDAGLVRAGMTIPLHAYGKLVFPEWFQPKSM
jgi:hypothetical protein